MTELLTLAGLIAAVIGLLVFAYKKALDSFDDDDNWPEGGATA